MTERRLLLVALGAVLSVVAQVRQARGAERQKPLTELLDVRPGATCVEAGALADQVAAWLGTATADADVWVHVTGRRTLRATARSGGGTRQRATQTKTRP
jgi:hypothetical protein